MAVDVEQRTAEVVFRAFAVPVRYIEDGVAAVTASAIIDRDVDVVSPQNQVIERRTAITFRKCDVPEPKRGAKVIEGDYRYVIDHTNVDDGYIVQVLIR